MQTEHFLLLLHIKSFPSGTPAKRLLRSSYRECIFFIMKISRALLAAQLFSDKLVYTSRCGHILRYYISGFGSNIAKGACYQRTQPLTVICRLLMCKPTHLHHVVKVNNIHTMLYFFRILCMLIIFNHLGLKHFLWYG